MSSNNSAAAHKLRNTPLHPTAVAKMVADKKRGTERFRFDVERDGFYPCRKLETIKGSIASAITDLTAGKWNDVRGVNPAKAIAKLEDVSTAYAELKRLNKAIDGYRRFLLRSLRRDISNGKFTEVFLENELEKFTKQLNKKLGEALKALDEFWAEHALRTTPPEESTEDTADKRELVSA